MKWTFEKALKEDEMHFFQRAENISKSNLEHTQGYQKKVHLAVENSQSAATFLIHSFYTKVLGAKVSQIVIRNKNSILVDLYTWHINEFLNFSNFIKQYLKSYRSEKKLFRSFL